MKATRARGRWRGCRLLLGKKAALAGERCPMDRPERITINPAVRFG
jgi:hypothetical protein